LLEVVVIIGFTAASGLCAVTQNSRAAQNDQSDIPDAPQPSKVPFPNAPPAPKTGPATTQPVPNDNPQPAPPPFSVKTVPPGSVPSTPNDEYKIITNVNEVLVPVRVRDGAGHLVPGLTRKDFTVYENGAPQQIRLFTSDPFPLSVAVVLDANLSDATMRKVRETLPALVGAFSEYDEAGIFTYGNSVQRQLDFTASSEQMSQALRRAGQHGRTNGPPVVTGPMTAGPSPSINGIPYNPSTPHVSNVHRESSVLNDAILAAANALSTRPRDRRKVIFVISDGLEDGSAASYSDVLRVLLSNDVSVYAIAVDAGAIPGYKTLGKVHIPLMGYGNILPKYASATAGEVYPEFTQDAIESAYARVTNEARNQYTISYAMKNPEAGNYRSIEVRVDRPDLDVRAKDGYYPLPPVR
jgi:VWFA-related protein